jgi:hypothetical protein
LTPEVANSCRCIDDDPPEAFNKAKVIFIGQMLSGTERWSDYETIDDRIRRVPIEAETVEIVKRNSGCFKWLGDAHRIGIFTCLALCVLRNPKARKLRS